MIASNPLTTDFSSQALELAASIHSFSTTAELTRALWHLNALTGANGCVFSTFTLEDETMESFRYLVACPSAWCHEYNKNHWYTLDPCFVYAANNSEPALIQCLPLRSDGQKTMMEAAKSAGFKSGIVVPAHSPSGRSRMGLLYMGSSDPDHFNVQKLTQYRVVLRSIAAECLEWWIKKIKEELIERVDLKHDEIEILRYTQRGMQAKDIAYLCGLTKDAVEKKLSRLALRFNTTNKKKTAAIAESYGLLE